ASHAGASGRVGAVARVQPTDRRSERQSFDRAVADAGRTCAGRFSRSYRSVARRGADDGRPGIDGARPDDRSAASIAPRTRPECRTGTADRPDRSFNPATRGWAADPFAGANASALCAANTAGGNARQPAAG